MDAEVTIGSGKGLRIESEIDRVNLAIDADGDEMRLSIDALVLHLKLHVGGRNRPKAGDTGWSPVLVSRVPDLPDSVSERALGRELVPGAVDDLIDVVLDSKRCVGGFNVLIQAEDEMGDRRIVPESLPP